MSDFILSIDQGTTSCRAIVFNKKGEIVKTAQQEFPQIYPHDGWVEHDPEAIWKTSLSTAKRAMKKSHDMGGGVAAIGITNQRETCVVWDRKTGNPIYNAIVWQDRRTAETCRKLASAGHSEAVADKTGLLLDPYFSATKMAWILDHVEGARARAENGELAAGTIDTFLIWRLTGGKSHLTDASNASRTSLFNIKSQEWDDELLKAFGVPKAILPDVRDCADDFGTAKKSVLGADIPVCGVAGDQQAAAIGQGCFAPGDIKSTYGTGCFVLLNTGTKKLASQNRLLSTIAYRLNGKTTYALEGSIFVAGAAVQWLRDGLKIIKSAAETEGLAIGNGGNNGLYLVPAFTGLGAPHWDAEARGALYGLTRATGPNEIAKATLEAVCYQTHDLLEAMQKDWKSSSAKKTVLRVDGGMVASDWTMQFLSNVLNAPVDRPTVLETTALGAAWLAGSRAGVWPDQKGFAKTWARDTRFKPKMKSVERQRKLAGWKDAVSRTLTQVSNPN